MSSKDKHIFRPANPHHSNLCECGRLRAALERIAGQYSDRYGGYPEAEADRQARNDLAEIAQEALAGTPAETEAEQWECTVCSRKNAAAEKLTRELELRKYASQQADARRAERDRLRAITDGCPVCSELVRNTVGAHETEARHTLDCAMVKHPNCTQCDCGSFIDTHRDPSRPSDGQKVIRDAASASVRIPVEDPICDGSGHPAGLQSGVPPREANAGGVTSNAGAPGRGTPDTETGGER